MPTLRGWFTGAVAVVFLITGYAFGRVELDALGVASATALVSAVVNARLARSRLVAERHVRPTRVHHSSPSTVELVLKNHGRRTSPCLAVEAFEDSTARATSTLSSRPPPDRSTVLEVPALERGASVRAAYHPPTDRRGRFAVGPLTLRREDPFGLAQYEHRMTGVGDLIVYPRIHPLTPMPAVPAQDLQSMLIRSAASLDGEEFFALRPYQVGDDIRRAHWPSLARTDELMIRQFEPPREERVTVVLDVGGKTNTLLSLEFTTSVAASILTASHRAGSVIRLVTTDGGDSGFDRSAEHWERTLEQLAIVTPAARANLVGTLRRLGRGSTGSVAVVATSMTPTELDAISWLGGRSGGVVLALVDRSAYAGRRTGTPTPTPTPRHVRVARISDAASLPAEWAAAVRRPRSAAATRRGSALR